MVQLSLAVCLECTDYQSHYFKKKVQSYWEKKTLINDQSTDKSLNDVEYKEAVEKCVAQGRTSVGEPM